MSDLYFENEIAQAYKHLLSAYKFEQPVKEKQNIMDSCLSLLKAAPKDTKIKRLNNQGAHTTPFEEIEQMKTHCKNHGIELSR